MTTSFGQKNHAPTGEVFLQVFNRSGWRARDVEVEVRYRQGSPEVFKRALFDASPRPDGSYEPPWEVPLSRVRVTGVDPFGDAGEIIESVNVTFSDYRDIGRYKLSIPVVTAQGAMPFDERSGSETRLR